MATHPNRSKKTKAGHKRIVVRGKSAKPKAARAAGLTATPARAEQHKPGCDPRVLIKSVSDAFWSLRDAEHLFTTDARDLWDLYLRQIPTEHRQRHNCNACRHFVEHYGSLVQIKEDGSTEPAMWRHGSVGSIYDPAIHALHGRVKAAAVTGPFYCSEDAWGHSITGPYAHMAVVPPRRMVHTSLALTAGQTMAAARESYKTVADFLASVSYEAIAQVIMVLKNVRQGERYIAPMEWLLQLKQRPKAKRGRNLLWLAVANAPEGFLHPRASVAGSIFEDIAAGMDFDTIKKRFDKKLNPLVYQRPQAAPAAGNIKAGEDLIERMGLAKSLERRFARVDEIPHIWEPKGHVRGFNTRGAGLFAHITPKSGHRPMTPLSMHRGPMTWVKFEREVMPSAERIVAHIDGHPPMIALTTAVHYDAPPIMKWDSDEYRNAFAWYVYAQTHPASRWGLMPQTWVDVTAISTLPTMWGKNDMSNLHRGVVLVLKGARDLVRGAGAALFPECLRSELHPVRATIEAYSKTAQLAGNSGDDLACGLDIRDGQSRRVTVRAYGKGGGSVEYQIDRWD